MHILWIKTELLHPVDKGGKIRTYQMLRALAKDHQVTYLCLDDGLAAPHFSARRYRPGVTIHDIRVIQGHIPVTVQDAIGVVLLAHLIAYSRCTLEPS